MIICYHNPLNPDKCPICKQIVNNNLPVPNAQIRQKSRQIYSLPCVHEGAILEWCNTCNGESKHVRECDIYDKCTRGFVSNKVKSCMKCAQESNTPYVPDLSQVPKSISSELIMAPNSRRYLLRKMLEEKASRRAQNQNPDNKIPERKVESDPIGYRRTSEMLAISKLKPSAPIKWAYGITTVPSRRTTTLPKTIQSLIMAGFDSPRLFIDIQGETYLPDLVKEYQTDFNLPITIRDKNIRTFGNWLLALMELYIREPSADRYIIFQDDIVACSNLREYMEHVQYPINGYINLITYPQNDREKYRHAKELGIDANTMIGWYPSNQMGKGAQGLVFNRDAVLVLLSNHNILKRPQSANGWQNIDGGINEAMKRAGYLEYVHTPSLIGHQGGKTTMGPTHPQEQPQIQSFRGQEWDAMEVVNNL